MELPPSKVLPLSEIQPYWRNPRTIPDDAIDAVATSITEYGYVQPIVVDRDNVIVVGHTRREALLRMGVTEVEVYVTDLPPEKAREYRVADNRLGEMSDWDHEKLVTELREWEENLLTAFFPDLAAEVLSVGSAVEDVTTNDLAQAERNVLNPTPAAEVSLTSVVCPSCFHTFEVRTDSLPGLTRGEVAHGGVG